MPASSIMAVVVVYERGIDQVAPWPRVRSWLNVEASSASRLEHVLVYDNSPQPMAAAATAVARCSYIHDPNNGGTAAAYIAAAKLAAELGIGWLLLLDHDSTLDEAFLIDARDSVRAPTSMPSVAAWLPRVRHRLGRYISPVRVTRAGTFRPLLPGDLPGAGEHVSAIASGSVLNVAALTEILPLPPGLWLDYVDHWIFAEFHRRKFRCLISERVMEHDLSVISRESLNARRIHSILHGEAIFQRQLGLSARLIYPWRRLWRALRYAFTNPRASWAMIAGSRPHSERFP